MDLGNALRHYKLECWRQYHESLFIILVFHAFHPGEDSAKTGSRYFIGTESAHNVSNV